ncbi:diguanylate cyclase [Paenibacillus sp. HB172176]|uniref:sensor domain-containing protein n=1 Tax=Paenibacillus sp. HB172176 TaxID=2493690 RepID=UPI001439180C|nr:diguanylate cyclase [Paenibacillus sp. HB172176]
MLPYNPIPDDRDNVNENHSDGASPKKEADVPYQVDVQEMFAFIAAHSQNIITCFTPDGKFMYISPSVKALLGYEPEEVIGKHTTDFNHPEDQKRLHEHRIALSKDQNTVRFTARVRHKNGEYRWYETTVEYIRDVDGKLLQSIGVGRDITIRKQAEETIAHLAYHDPLTDLPNRRLFIERAKTHLNDTHNGLSGLMLLDLDGFKAVNDSYGHETGDRLLKEAAGRLAAAAGDQGFAARWGGDEFTVLLTDIANKEALFFFTERIKQAVAEPMMIDGHCFKVTASMGLSFFPEDGYTVEALIKHADAEMYRAKGKEKLRKTAELRFDEN